MVRSSDKSHGDYGKAIALTAKIADAWLPHKIRYDRIPGIVHNGKPVYRKGFGYADVEADIAVVTLTNTNDSSCAAINTGIFETIHALVDGKSDRGAKLAQPQRFEGAYRSRWIDMVVVGVGARLAAFDPKVSSPIKHGVMLSVHGANRFTTNVPAGFDSPGEFATFSFERGAKKATKLFFGASPLTRLEHLA